jgi:hypothetical protein
MQSSTSLLHMLQGANTQTWEDDQPKKKESTFKQVNSNKKEKKKEKKTKQKKQRK